MSQTDVNLFLESYLFPDWQSKLHYNTLTEAEQQAFTKDTVMRLFNCIKKKTLKVNYMGLEKTKGDITAYPKYDDVANSINILENMYKSDPSNSPEEIMTLVTAHKNLLSLKGKFQTAFTQKNEVAAILYVNIYAALISAVAKVISVTVEYVKTPTGDYKTIFNSHVNELRSDSYFDSLKKFNTMAKNGELEKVFGIGKLTESGMTLSEFAIEPIITLVTGGAVGTVAGVIIGIVVVLYIISSLPYRFYCARKKLSDKLLALAVFIEAHQSEIDTSTERGQKAKDKQAKIAAKLRTLGNAISLDDKNSEKQAEKDSEQDEKDSRKTNDSESDDDILF